MKQRADTRLTFSPWLEMRHGTSAGLQYTRLTSPGPIVLVVNIKQSQGRRPPLSDLCPYPKPLHIS
jgi:hypothetical protein